HADVGEVERQLRDAVLLDVPADALHRLELAGDLHGFAVGIEHGLAGEGIALALHTAGLTDVEGDGIGAACAGGVEVDVVRHEEVPRADGDGPTACHAVVVRGR